MSRVWGFQVSSCLCWALSLVLEIVCVTWNDTFFPVRIFSNLCGTVSCFNMPSTPPVDAFFFLPDQTRQCVFNIAFLPFVFYIVLALLLMFLSRSTADHGIVFFVFTPHFPLSAVPAFCVGFPVFNCVCLLELLFKISRTRHSCGTQPVKDLALSLQWLWFLP